MGSQRRPEGPENRTELVGDGREKMLGGDGLLAPPGMVRETGRKDQAVLSCFRPKADLKLEPKETWSN